MFISCEDFFIIVKNQYTCTYKYMLVHAYTTVSMHMPSIFVCVCPSHVVYLSYILALHNWYLWHITDY